jgi:hypothetical protein
MTKFVITQEEFVQRKQLLVKIRAHRTADGKAFITRKHFSRNQLIKKLNYAKVSDVVHI